MGRPTRDITTWFIQKINCQGKRGRRKRKTIYGSYLDPDLHKLLKKKKTEGGQIG